MSTLGMYLLEAVRSCQTCAIKEINNVITSVYFNFVGIWGFVRGESEDGCFFILVYLKMISGQERMYFLV